MKRTTSVAIVVVTIVITLLVIYLSSPKTPAEQPVVVPPVENAPNATPEKIPSPFDLMSDDDLYQYALNQSMTTGNAEDCEVIRNENDKGNCKDITNQYRAMNDNSTAACDNIEFFGTREVCLETVRTRIATNEGNLGECDKIERPDIRTGCYDNVYAAMARKNLDKPLCAKISTAQGKNDCIFAVNADKELSLHPDDIAPPDYDPTAPGSVPPLDMPQEYMDAENTDVTED